MWSPRQVQGTVARVVAGWHTPMAMTWLLAALLGGAPVPESGYENRLVAWALERSGRELALAPEGLVVEEVVVVIDDVFAPTDPYPMALNIFHTRTLEPVVRREVLLEKGQRYDAALAQETERNLRKLFFLAVTKVVAAQGRDGGVALVVATKDKWSLRLSNSFTLIGSLLQYLNLQLTEANFLGRGQSLSGGTTVRLDTFSLNLTFIEPRVFDSRVHLGATGSAVINRQTGAPEGTSGGLLVQRPLSTLDQQWGFVVDSTWNVQRKRVYRGASIWQLPYPEERSGVTVPYVYDARELASEATLTRSFGRAVKLNVSLALGAYHRLYTPPRESALDQEQIAWLKENWLPRSETATFTSASVQAYQADFRVLRNFETYELSEDFQLGWSGRATFRWAFPSPVAPVSFVELSLALRYRLYAGDDLLVLSVAGASRIRPGESPANQHLAVELINYSPPFYGGRFVARLLLDFIANDLNHRRLLLGGSTGLRGMPPEQLMGRNMVLANFEYRLRPFEAWASWLGIVLFYDVGSAFDLSPALTHTTGLGLRLLLPQLNREVIRVDFGLVIGGPPPGPGTVNASWGQVTALRPTFLDSP